MYMKGKIKACKEIILRLYKNHRADILKSQRVNGLNRSPIFKGTIFEGVVEPAQLFQVILPHFKEQGLLLAFGWDDERGELDLTFNTEEMEQLMTRKDLSLESSDQNNEVQFDDINCILSYGNRKYKPQGRYQKLALWELWKNRKEPKTHNQGNRRPLATFGADIKFDSIESTQMFSKKMNSNSNFSNKFEDFYKGIRRAISRTGMPAEISVEGNGILLIIK